MHLESPMLFRPSNACCSPARYPGAPPASFLSKFELPHPIPWLAPGRIVDFPKEVFANDFSHDHCFWLCSHSRARCSRGGSLRSVAEECSRTQLRIYVSHANSRQPRGSQEFANLDSAAAIGSIPDDQRPEDRISFPPCESPRSGISQRLPLSARSLRLRTLDG